MAQLERIHPCFIPLKDSQRTLTSICLEHIPSSPMAKTPYGVHEPPVSSQMHPISEKLKQHAP